MGGNIVSLNTINQFSTQKLLKNYDGITFNQTFQDDYISIFIFSYSDWRMQVGEGRHVKHLV